MNRKILIGACFFTGFLLSGPTTGFTENGPERDNPFYLRGSVLGFQNQDSDIITRTLDPIVETRVPGKSMEFDPGYGVSAALGFKTDHALNTELEFTGRWIGLDNLHTTTGDFEPDGDLESFAFMFNIPYMFHNATRWTPYLGGGIGLAWQRGDVQNIGDGTIGPVTGEQTNIAYQVLAGIYYEVDERWDVMLGYRFFGTPDPEYNTLQFQNRSHNLEIGLRYHLPDKKLKRRKRAVRKMRSSRSRGGVQKNVRPKGRIRN